MKLTAMALATAFALSSTCAFAHTRFVTGRTLGPIPCIGMLARQSSCIRTIRTAISAGTVTAMRGVTGAPTMGP